MEIYEGTGVLPEDVWRIILDLVIESRKQELRQSRNPTFWSVWVSSVGNLVMKNKISTRPSTSFTLTALKRTCKTFRYLLEPYTDPITLSYSIHKNKSDKDLIKKLSRLSLKIAKK
jgi:hypothetical protein